MAQDGNGRILESFFHCLANSLHSDADEKLSPYVHRVKIEFDILDLKSEIFQMFSISFLTNICCVGLDWIYEEVWCEERHCKNCQHCHWLTCFGLGAVHK